MTTRAPEAHAVMVGGGLAGVAATECDHFEVKRGTLVNIDPSARSVTTVDCGMMQASAGH